MAPLFVSRLEVSGGGPWCRQRQTTHGDHGPGRRAEGALCLLLAGGGGGLATKSTTVAMAVDVTTVLCHINQPGQEGRRGERTGELFCLFSSPTPPTHTSSVYLISLKAGGSRAQAAASPVSNDARRPWA